MEEERKEPEQTEQGEMEDLEVSEEQAEDVRGGIGRHPDPESAAK